MGQNKSKIAALEEEHGEPNLVGVKAKKSSKQRKWRKKKGYSLSVSLEGDLNCDVDPGSFAGRSARDGPVLVSYSVWKGENEALGRRNSYQHGSSGNEFAIREDESTGTINCMNIHQPLQHPPLGQDLSDEPSEKGETCNDFVENDLVQSILTKNTQNSDVFISKEEPPCSTKTKTRIDNKSFPLPTSSENSSVLSVSPTQGK